MAGAVPPWRGGELPSTSYRQDTTGDTTASWSTRASTLRREPCGVKTTLDHEAPRWCSVRRCDRWEAGPSCVHERSRCRSPVRRQEHRLDVVWPLLDAGLAATAEVGGLQQRRRSNPGQKKGRRRATGAVWGRRSLTVAYRGRLDTGQRGGARRRRVGERRARTCAASLLVGCAVLSGGDRARPKTSAST